MDLQHIKLDGLTTTAVNVRKHGGKDIADLEPSIRALGLLQPLLVRPNGLHFEVVAGQRRYHALSRIAQDTDLAPVPCIVMAEGDCVVALTDTHSDAAASVAGALGGTGIRSARDGLSRVVGRNSPGGEASGGSADVSASIILRTAPSR